MREVADMECLQRLSMQCIRRIVERCRRLSEAVRCAVIAVNSYVVGATQLDGDHSRTLNLLDATSVSHLAGRRTATRDDASRHHEIFVCRCR